MNGDVHITVKVKIVGQMTAVSGCDVTSDSLAAALFVARTTLDEAERLIASRRSRQADA